MGALVDRNGLRPAAFSVTRDRMVAVASEAGAVPFSAAETIRRGRLGPGQLLLVEPGRHAILEDADAKHHVLRRLAIHDAPRAASTRIGSRRPSRPTASTPRMRLRHLAGLDAERARLDIKTMALEGHEPLWSMGDDTPTPGRARLDRPVADHLRQAFAQVTNPAIDPERERVVMDLRVELGRRPALLGGMPRAPRTARLQRPIVADLDGLLDEVRRQGATVRTLDATWACGRRAGRADRRARPTRRATRVARSRRGATILVVTDRAWSMDRLPIPSILATGAVHTALTAAGLRGRTDIAVSAVDVLDVHAMAMLLAVGATAVQPRLAIELAAELAGTRGAEEKAPVDTVGSLLDAFEAGLRKTLARMGISAVSSYIGGALIDVVDLDASRRRPLLPDGRRLARPDDPRRPGRAAAPTPRGRPGDPGAGRPAVSRACPDPGFARFRADGEAHLFSPRIAGEITLLAVGGADGIETGDIDAQLARYRAALARPPAEHAVPRDELRVRHVRTPAAAGRGRGRAVDRAPLRRLGHERRCVEPRGAPGPDHRHPARGRGGQHRRGRRGSRLVRAGAGRPAGTTPGSSRSPRPASE